MATRSTIAKLGKDGIIKSVYCHSNGYLEWNGRILNEHYRDESKVDELLAHGDISSLDKNIGEKLPFNDYTSFIEKEQCRFYHRDRGEESKINEFTSTKDYSDYGKEIGSYIYLYAYGEWYIYKDGSFVELEEELKEVNV